MDHMKSSKKPNDLSIWRKVKKFKSSKISKSFFFFHHDTLTLWDHDRRWKNIFFYRWFPFNWLSFFFVRNSKDRQHRLTLYMCLEWIRKIMTWIFLRSIYDRLKNRIVSFMELFLFCHNDKWMSDSFSNGS